VEAVSTERCAGGIKPGAEEVGFAAPKRQHDPAETDASLEGGGAASHLPQSSCVEGRIGQCLTLAAGGAACAPTKRESVRKPMSRRATASSVWVSPSRTPNP